MKIQQLTENYGTFAGLCFRIFVDLDNRHYWDCLAKETVDSEWTGKNLLLSVSWYWEEE